MAGVDVGGKQGKRRSVDSEINMIPMIDLLMVTISFLLITAVWVHAQRLEGTAQTPGSSVTPPCDPVDCKAEPRLHVETADRSKFVLAWRQGSTVVRTVDVPREGRRKAALASLASKVTEEWSATGQHRDARDRQFDHAVVHASNDMAYSELIAIMDAIGQPKRPYAVANKTSVVNAFDVTLATD